MRFHFTSDIVCMASTVCLMASTSTFPPIRLSSDGLSIIAVCVDVSTRFNDFCGFQFIHSDYRSTCFGFNCLFTPAIDPPVLASTNCPLRLSVHLFCLSQSIHSGYRSTCFVYHSLSTPAIGPPVLAFTALTVTTYRYANSCH